MAKYSIELEQWANYTRNLSQDQLLAVNVPLHVLFGEAVDVAKFFGKYWESEVDENGQVTRLGLDSAVPKNGQQGGVGRLNEKTGEEILSLQRAAQEAQTHYLLTIEKNGASPMARGQFLLGEMTAALSWYFDDGIEDDKDEMLARLDAAHTDDPQTQDALASALDDYALLADRYREGLDGLGGFSAAYIDEARAVARELRNRSARVEAAVTMALARRLRRGCSRWPPRRGRPWAPEPRNRVISVETQPAAPVCNRPGVDVMVRTPRLPIRPPSS